MRLIVVLLVLGGETNLNCYFCGIYTLALVRWEIKGFSKKYI